MSVALYGGDLLASSSTNASFDAFVVAAAFDASGLPGFALGDGTVRLCDGPLAGWRSVEAHDGGALCLAAAPGGGFVSGGDDGRLVGTSAAGQAVELAGFGGRWVEQVATHRDAKSGDAKGLIACSAGKVAQLMDASGARLKSLQHPSTVTGLAFDAKGKRIAAAHYNGASLWFVAAKTDSPRRLEWKGSHTGIALHPAGEAVVTSMQDNALHGWRLPDGQHMRMSGYPSKTAALSFSRHGRWLASSGAEVIVLWPFFGGGPMGKPPRELGGGNSLCTRVACHPEHDTVAAGYEDGSVVLAEIGEQRILPIAGPGRGAVSALAWSDDGSALAFGTESGFAAVVRKEGLLFEKK